MIQQSEDRQYVLKMRRGCKGCDIQRKLITQPRGSQAMVSTPFFNFWWGRELMRMRHGKSEIKRKQVEPNN